MERVERGRVRVKEAEEKEEGLLVEELSPEIIFGRHFDTNLAEGEKETLEQEDPVSRLTTDTRNWRGATRRSRNVATKTEEMLLSWELEWNRMLIERHPEMSTPWIHRTFIILLCHTIRPDKFVDMMKREKIWMMEQQWLSEEGEGGEEVEEGMQHVCQKHSKRYLQSVRTSVCPFDDEREMALRGRTLMWSFIVSYIGKPFGGFQRQSEECEKEVPSVQGVLEVRKRKDIVVVVVLFSSFLLFLCFHCSHRSLPQTHLQNHTHTNTGGWKNSPDGSCPR